MKGRGAGYFFGHVHVHAETLLCQELVEAALPGSKSDQDDGLGFRV